MAFAGWGLLILAQLHSLAASSVHAEGNLTHHSAPFLCLPDQANALLKLKQSLFSLYFIPILPSWQAGTDCCVWEGVGCSNSSGHVTALDLSGIGLYSRGIDPVLFNLTSLRLLDLSNNDFGGQQYHIPSVGFEKLALLTHLNLSNIGISGQIPAGISKLKNLISLDLGAYVFSSYEDGSIIDFVPNYLQEGYFHNLVTNLTNLRELILDGVSISSRAEDCFKVLANSTPHLRILSLASCGLQGHLDRSLKNLRSLVVINLSGNYGEIPTSLFTLTTLQALDLSGNELSGPIEEFEVTSSHLRLIDLSRNQLIGPIPKSFFLLTSLIRLDISWNSLTGSVDLASLWRLENLTYLALSNNKLSVMDGEGNNDSSSTYLSALRDLELANCNITKIPNFLTRVNKMAGLDLSSNKISGNIPKWMWEGWNSSLKSLNLSNNMFTGMELSSYVIPFSSYLITFDISSNRLQGQVPMLSLSAEFLDYSNNTFSSILPNFTLYLSKTSYLSLSKNKISGYLPNSICELYIDVLDLSYNNFKGLIPTCLMGKGSPIILNLRENQFEGVLPSNISSGCSLQTIDFNGNKIEGQLPRALYNCINLEVLDLGRNKITDTFPSLLGILLHLHVLVLRSNQFHGSISYLKDENSGENFPSLQILDLASNNFSGNLHPRWFENLKGMEKYNNTGQIIVHQNLSTGIYKDIVTISYKGSFVTFKRILTTLTTIDLSDNALNGSIPISIGKLASLHLLNMSHNAFTGEIPCQFGGMTALESLDMSSNMLSGEIPQELTNLTFLSTLNLSDNQLKGKIPQSHQFATFENGSFDGNAELCGLPLSKQCETLDNPNETHLKSSSDGVDIVLFLLVGAGFGMGFAAAVLARLGWIRRWFLNVNSVNVT